MTGADVLPWSHYAPELRDEIKRLAGRWPAQTVADAAQRFADVVGAHGRTPDTDWQALGWRHDTEHAEFVDDLRERTLRLPADAQSWIRSQRRAAGIPDRGPYSVDQVETIDDLITAAEDRNGERDAA